MAYTKHNFNSGDKLFASQLNEMDEQISANEAEITRLNAQLEQATIEPAESVEWLNQNGDASKKYAIDGEIYAWMAKLKTIVHNAKSLLTTDYRTGQGQDKEHTAKDLGCAITSAIQVDNTITDYKLNIYIAEGGNGQNYLYPKYYSPLYIYYYAADGSQIGWNNAKHLELHTDSATNIDLPIGPVNIATATCYNGSANVTCWSQTKYIRIVIGVGNVNLTSNPNLIDGLVINLEPLNQTVPEYGWYSTGQQHSNDRATQQNTADIEILKERAGNLESRTSELETDVATLMDGGLVSTATGQVLYAVGDSITYGYGVGGNSHSWVKHVIDRNGYDSTKCLNLGQSGLGFCTTSASGKTLTDVMSGTNFSGADIVTVALGINDWKNMSATLTDFFEGMRYSFNKIRTDNPYCKIFYILPFNARFLGTFDTFYCLGTAGDSNKERPYAYTLQTFINMIKAKFEEEDFKSFHVHVIDMVECPAINRYNMTSADTFIDSVHPSAECHKELAKEIARRIALA